MRGHRGPYEALPSDRSLIVRLAHSCL